MQKIKSADQTFHNGDGRQELGTVVTAEWLNAVQGELVAAIEGAAIVLNDNDNGQLLKAINKIVTTAVGGANQNANGKVSKTGDTMTGALTVKSTNPGQMFGALKLQNEGTTTNTAVGVDIWLGDKQRGWLGYTVNGQGSDFYVANVASIGTVGALLRANDTGLWLRPYGGWLHDYFAKKDEARWTWNSYPSHHRGAQVFYHAASGLKIITMTVNTASGQSLIQLPESFTGYFVPIGCDVGSGKFAIGASANGQSGISVYTPAAMTCHFICIGYHK